VAAVSVVPMFLSIIQCADYNDMATEGKAWWSYLHCVRHTAGPFVGVVRIRR